MAEETELAFYEFHSTRIVDHVLDVLQLPRESVASERVRVRERLSVSPDSAPREIESDRCQSVLCQCANSLNPWQMTTDPSGDGAGKTSPRMKSPSAHGMSNASGLAALTSVTL